MRTEENPGVGTRASDETGELSTAIIPANKGGFTFPVADPLHEERLHGWLEGYHSRDAEVSNLNYTADRLYAEMCRRTPPKQPDLTSYADMQKIRADIYGGRK